jgi:hypothetical protein
VHIDFLKNAGSEVMDRKRGGNQGSTSHLLCSSIELPTKTILGDRDEDMLFSVMVSRIGIRQISSQDLGPIVIRRSIAIISYSKQKLTCAFSDQTNNF